MFSPVILRHHLRYGIFGILLINFCIVYDFPEFEKYFRNKLSTRKAKVSETVEIMLLAREMLLHGSPRSEKLTELAQRSGAVRPKVGRASQARKPSRARTKVCEECCSRDSHTFSSSSPGWPTSTARSTAAGWFAARCVTF